MPLPDPNLEPAIRDPKKLRNTAFVLVAMIFLGWCSRPTKNGLSAKRRMIGPLSSIGSPKNGTSVCSAKMVKPSI